MHIYVYIYIYIYIVEISTPITDILYITDEYGRPIGDSYTIHQGATLFLTCWIEDPEWIGPDGNEGIGL